MAIQKVSIEMFQNVIKSTSKGKKTKKINTKISHGTYFQYVFEIVLTQQPMLTAQFLTSHKHCFLFVKNTTCATDKI